MMKLLAAVDLSKASERYLDERDELNELVTQLVDADVNASALMAQGDPVKTILRQAERLDAELIVVGSHGHGMMFDALMGSISAGILRKSTIPVLVVPIRGNEPPRFYSINGQVVAGIGWPGFWTCHGRYEIRCCNTPGR
jgi:hypothetical protein